MFEFVDGQTTRQLRSDSPLTSDDFLRIAAALGVEPFEARKESLVRARRTLLAETVVTHWNGVETVNRAHPGDWVVTSLDVEGLPLYDSAGHTNMYIIGADAFRRLYRLHKLREGDTDLYKAVSTVQAIALPGGFDIASPWGERQRGGSGYLILNGSDVYGNARDTFERTYTPTEGRES